ncbi:tonB-system energizer ExbB [Croceicoccus mobilis]|uniref:Biopolymer transport protein ExbB n=2 Tax=Croceicoccus mobilis TaxID=1703339 RepID=A0A916Z6A0_9SPHN|nr:tonB-system energizer ExbB [Croceicoccus mobilis]
MLIGGGALTMPHAAFANAASAQGGPVIPSDLSVWGMFAQADWVVKLIMIGLVIASVVTWTVLVAKHLELARQRKSAEAFRDTLLAAPSLSALDQTASAHAIVAEAREEIAQSGGALDDREGLKERLVSRLDRYEARVARKMTQGVTILGTIGATAPFVGLFGTVWGIMNSFIGIAEMQTTNLAVVAPGIAEALLATALGLVAAIPAVVIYNHFARAIAAHRAIVSDSAAALLRIVSRDLSRGTLAGA